MHYISNRLYAGIFCLHLLLLAAFSTASNAANLLGPVRGSAEPVNGTTDVPFVARMRCSGHGFHGSHATDYESRTAAAGETFVFPWMYRGLFPASCGLSVFHPLYVSRFVAIDGGFHDVGTLHVTNWSDFLDAGPPDPPINTGYKWPVLELRGHLRDILYYYLPEFTDTRFMHAVIPVLRQVVLRTLQTGAFGYTEMFHRDSPVENLRRIEDAVDYPGSLTRVLNAAGENNVPALRAALEAGAWTDGWNVGGDSALYICVREGHLEALDVLLEYGADVHFKSSERQMSAVQTALFKRRWKIAARLLQAGAEWRGAQTRPDWLASALSDAAFAGDVDALRIFLRAGMPVDAAPSNQVTPLMHAARGGQLDAAKLLIAHGANVNAQGSHNRYALRYARESKSDALVQLLIEEGAKAD